MASTLGHHMSQTSPLRPLQCTAAMACMALMPMGHDSHACTYRHECAPCPDIVMTASPSPGDTGSPVLMELCSGFPHPFELFDVHTFPSDVHTQHLIPHIFARCSFPLRERVSHNVHDRPHREQGCVPGRFRSSCHVLRPARSSASHHCERLIPPCLGIPGRCMLPATS